ncbi:MAG TPA: DMT family transporter [Gemmatimonadales bacterium]|nr:DMT family transporter [Gemmatimonadales bacterium]
MSPRLVLLLAVLATTYAGPIIRFAAAPALAIAFWRLAFALPVTATLWGRESSEGEDRSNTTILLMLLSGTLLALHFWTWITSLRYTSVASSVLIVNLRPIIVWGLAAVWLGEHPEPRERWGIALAVIGAVLIGVGDARFSWGAFTGDVLALFGATAAAGYSVIGRRVRRTVGIWRYATIVYGVAAVVLVLVAVLTRTRLWGFAARDWGIFAALAAGPMLVGHTGINYALKHLRATTVNVAGLGEPVGATLIAWLLPSIHEIPRPSTLAGGALVVGGIALALATSGGGDGRR